MATRSTTHKNEKQTGRTGKAKAVRGERRDSDDFYEDYEDTAEGYLARGNAQFQEMVEDHEGQAVLVALAVGFGIGVVLGYGIGAPFAREEHWTDRVAAEGVGRRLLERLDSMLPEAITSRFAK